MATLTYLFLQFFWEVPIVKTYVIVRVLLIYNSQWYYTDMCRLTTGMRSEKCVFRRFSRCTNVIECTYTNLDSVAYYTPSLYGIASFSKAANLYSMLLY
jgi:hypothetical protein